MWLLKLRTTFEKKLNPLRRLTFFRAVIFWAGWKISYMMNLGWVSLGDCPFRQTMRQRNWPLDDLRKLAYRCTQYMAFRVWWIWLAYPCVASLWVQLLDPCLALPCKDVTVNSNWHQKGENNDCEHPLNWQNCFSTRGQRFFEDVRLPSYVKD